VTGIVPTLADLNRHEPHWLWWNCDGCRRWVSAPLAPFVIRWGADASSDLLRRNPRCTKCGHSGGVLQVPSHHTIEQPQLRFQVEEGIGSIPHQLPQQHKKKAANQEGGEVAAK